MVGFTLAQGLTTSTIGDLLILAATVVCGLGYAEGARLLRTLGGCQVISRPLVTSLPIMGPLSMLTIPSPFANIALPTWIRLDYVSLFRRQISFVFWYRGPAQGDMAAFGQLQLLQPFVGLALAGTRLREPVTMAMLITSAAVVSFVFGARRFAR